jgi:hypothetical protein
LRRGEGEGSEKTESDKKAESMSLAIEGADHQGETAQKQTGASSTECANYVRLRMPTYTDLRKKKSREREEKEWSESEREGVSGE